MGRGLMLSRLVRVLLDWVGTTSTATKTIVNSCTTTKNQGTCLGGSTGWGVDTGGTAACHMVAGVLTGTGSKSLQQERERERRCFERVRGGRGRGRVGKRTGQCL